MTETGMQITISVSCQRCDDGYLNTLGQTPEHAHELAESMGWQLAPNLGWVCPQCGDA